MLISKCLYFEKIEIIVCLLVFGVLALYQIFLPIFCKRAFSVCMCQIFIDREKNVISTLQNARFGRKNMRIEM